MLLKMASYLGAFTHPKKLFFGCVHIEMRF